MTDLQDIHDHANGDRNKQELPETTGGRSSAPCAQDPCENIQVRMRHVFANGCGGVALRDAPEQSIWRMLLSRHREKNTGL
eukprot:3047179-Rhodomonas_salina.1